MTTFILKFLNNVILISKKIFSMKREYTRFCLSHFNPAGMARYSFFKISLSHLLKVNRVGKVTDPI